jgi:hypothetical protein
MESVGRDVTTDLGPKRTCMDAYPPAKGHVAGSRVSKLFLFEVNTLGNQCARLSGELPV